MVEQGYFVTKLLANENLAAQPCKAGSSKFWDAARLSDRVLYDFLI